MYPEVFLMKLWKSAGFLGFCVLLVSCGFFKSSTPAQATQYPEFVASYEAPASSLYRLSATTETSQAAELRFNRGGKLSMVRTGSNLSFTSSNIDPSLLGKKVDVKCSSVRDVSKARKIGDFTLGKNPTLTCPTTQPYAFFWVNN